MKKTSMILAAAFLAALSTSCSKDETVSVNQGKGISFRTFTSSVTRATDITTQNLAAFHVHALQGTDVAGSSPVWEDDFSSALGGSGTGDGTDFTSTTVHFWPGDGTPLHFFAYNKDALSGGTPSVNGTSQTITGVTPVSSAADQKDLVVAYAKGDNTTNESTPVSINFKHMFSKIVVKAYNTNYTSLKVEVAGVRINGVNGTGTLTLPQDTENSTTISTAATWLPADNSTSMDGDYQIVQQGLSTSSTPIELGADPQSIMDFGDGPQSVNNAYMLLPQKLTAWTPQTPGAGTTDGAYISVLCRISQSNGNGGWTQMFPDAVAVPANQGKYAWTAVPIDTQWEPGNCYTYNLNFSNGGGTTDPEQPVDPTDPIAPVDPEEPVLGGKVTFTVTVSGWTNSSEVPVEM